ncbi:MAG TPA: SAM-dependent methyltransferase [Streptosporangiaceae bacterium]|nr:SAM-dependent methyltransferase [Streptosporangiaceae bacterium]
MPEGESAAHHGRTSGPLLPFDASKPNIARAYDYLLGGKDHFPPDRELGDKILAIYPGAWQMAKENRRFLRRALTYVLARGITQYADLGAGLPTSPAVHEIIRRHSRRAAVAYLDNDPVVLNHLYVMAAKPDRRVAAVPGDLADPATTLAALQTAGVIDLTAPACLILAMVLHFMDAPTARQVVSGYVAALAPGSYVIITVGHGDAGIGEQITAAYDAAPLFNHSPGDIASFFTSLDLVDPGITEARAWRPDWPGSRPFAPRAGHILAGVARKP